MFYHPPRGVNSLYCGIYKVGYILDTAAPLTVKFILQVSEGATMAEWNTLASHLGGRGLVPGMASSGKAGSCLPLVGSLQYRTLTNCMYWFPLPFQLPVVICDLYSVESDVKPQINKIR